MDKKWLMWGLLLPPYFFGFFHRTATSVVAVELARTLGLSGAIAGVLSAMYFYIYGAMQLPSGIFADTFGPRKMVSFGGIIMGISTIVFAYSDSLMFAMVARFCIGFGAAFIFVSLLKMQVNWFDEKDFPLLTGLSIFVGNCGALFGVGPFALMARALTWQNTYILFGVLSIISSCMVWIFVRDYPPDHPGRIENISASIAIKTVLKSRSNYISALGFGCAYGVYTAFTSLWGIPYFIDTYHLSKLDASTVITFIPLGTVCGCLFNGWVVRALGSARRASLVFLSAGLVLWTVVALVHIPQSHMYLYYPIFYILGFSISGINFIYTIVRELNTKGVAATALAFTNIGGFLMVSLFQPFFGWILDRSLVSGAAHTGGYGYPYSGYQTMLAVMVVLWMLAIAGYYFTDKKRSSSAPVA